MHTLIVEVSLSEAAVAQETMRDNEVRTLTEPFYFEQTASNCWSIEVPTEEEADCIKWSLIGVLASAGVTEVIYSLL